MKMISRYGVFLHLVEEGDAEFILKLRTDPKLNTYISYTNPNIDDQIKWIQSYKLKEEKGLEYYFITKDLNGNKFGTIRLYNFDEKSFELGSWIFYPNSPIGMAVKTHIIGLETGFELLNAEYCRLDVRKKNVGVIRYLKDYQPTIVNENELDYYFTISKENFYSRKNKLAIFSPTDKRQTIFDY